MVWRFDPTRVFPESQMSTQCCVVLCSHLTFEKDSVFWPLTMLCINLYHQSFWLELICISHHSVKDYIISSHRFSWWWFGAQFIFYMNFEKNLIPQISTSSSFFIYIYSFRYYPVGWRWKQDKGTSWAVQEWRMGCNLRYRLGYHWCWGRLSTARLLWCQGGKVRFLLWRTRGP